MSLDHNGFYMWACPVLQIHERPIDMDLRILEHEQHFEEVKRYIAILPTHSAQRNFLADQIETTLAHLEQEHIPTTDCDRISNLYVLLAVDIMRTSAQYPSPDTARINVDFSRYKRNKSRAF